MRNPRSSISSQAIVARTGPVLDQDRYLQLVAEGAVLWVADPASATPFTSMREAIRAALRLPAGLRAFGLPREPELALARVH